MKSLGPCPSSQKLTRAFLNGSIGAPKEHLMSCRKCAAEWSAMEKLAALGRELPWEAPSAERREELKAVLMTHAGSSRTSKSRPFWTICAAAAVVLVIAGAALFHLLPSLKRNTQQIGTGQHHGEYKGIVHPVMGATFRVTRPLPDESVRLIDGAVTIHVAPLKAGERFRVFTGDAELEVLGTVFDVAARSDRLASVHVLEGKVEVRRSDEKPFVVAVGGSWRAPEVTLPAPENGQAPEPETRPVVKRRQKPHAAAAPRIPTGSVPQPMERSGDRPRDDAAKPSAAEGSFAEGWSALKAGDFVHAAEAFKRSAAVAEADPIAEDARYWQAVSLVKGGKGSEARSSLELFLEKHPKSPRKGEASVHLGWILFRAGDLDGAERRFRSSENDKVSEVRKSAKEGLKTIEAARRRR